jgi:hypothetical protein
MSDSDNVQYWCDYYDAYVDQDEDDDDDDDDEDIERPRFMLAEKRVDDDVTRLGGTALQRKGYKMTEKEATNAEPYDKDSTIDYCNAFLEVLERDMKELEDDITNEMDVMKGYIQEKLNSYRENVSRPDYIAGSGNHMECFQDIAAMGRKMSQVKKAMENGKELGMELGFGEGLQDDVQYLQDNFNKEMDVMKGYIQEKLNSYRENVSRPDYIAGSGNHTKCFQDIAGMGRQMLLVKKAMQIGTELGIRQCLHVEKKETLMDLQLMKMSTEEINAFYTKKFVRNVDGSRGYILLPKKRRFANNN